MWIGSRGQMNIEVNWDDPWVAFDNALRSRLEALGPTELRQLDERLWGYFRDLRELVVREYAGRSTDDEEEFVNVGLERRVWLTDQEIDGDVFSVIRRQLDAADIRWRADILQAAIDATGQLI